MTVCQLALDEIDDPFHPPLLRLIDASSTAALPGQSDMVMKTYALDDEEAGTAVGPQRHENHVGHLAQEECMKSSKIKYLLKGFRDLCKKCMVINDQNTFTFCNLRPIVNKFQKTTFKK